MSLEAPLREIAIRLHSQGNCGKLEGVSLVNRPGRRIKGLGEVSIRVTDLAVMCAFYEDVVGLEVLRREDSFVFFEIGEGYGGHSQNLALFDASERAFLESKAPALSPGQSTLHHIALNIDLEDYESEMRRLQRLGLDVRATEHPWIHVRSLYFPDPEGNLVEFVCRDERVG
jgi:catechol 2,3-dioxygenase-like lactoylglutathione lyase family enzyme